MKKLSTLLITVFIGLVLLVPSTSAHRDDPTFWLVPHQDDELLTYGVSILSHEYTGHENHVVLLTDGSASRAMLTVSSKLENELRTEEFVIARDNEFMRSVGVLGIKYDNVHFKHYVDGQLTKEDVKDTVREIQETYPNARFKVMSYLDPHPDHKATGEALQEMYDDGEVLDVRFYLSASKFDVNQLSGIIVKRADEVQHDYIKAAIHAYDRWDPANGWYAIGYTSVPKSFEHLKETPYSMYHVPGYQLTYKKR